MSITVKGEIERKGLGPGTWALVGRRWGNLRT